MLAFFEWLITLVTTTVSEIGNGLGLEGRVSSAGEIRKSQRAILQLNSSTGPFVEDDLLS